MQQLLRNPRRISLLITGGLGLFCVYFFQHYLDFYCLFQLKAPRELAYTSDFVVVNPWSFSLNKVFRYLLNDLFAMAIIGALFPDRNYVRFAFAVLLFGLLVLVPSYIALYLAQPVGFSSLVGHLHRLVMNPILMMLLIPAFFYQRKLKEEADRENQ